MGRVTLIDSQTAGISGDMLLGALADAGAGSEIIQQVLDLIPKYYPKCKSIRVDIRKVDTHGFRASRVDLDIKEDDEEAQARKLIDAANDIARGSGISKKAATFATESVRTLVDAESRLHGADIGHAHLHEAGSSDTLADIFGVAAACDNLGIFEGQVYCTPVAVGGGNVSFSHGTIAVPAPAVLEILRQKGVPVVSGPEAVELATPTGVSMLVNLASVSTSTFPAMVPEAVGYGAGKRELAMAPNFLRIVIGRGLEHSSTSDTVQMLETNLDDLPGEVLGHALQRILDSGAKDAWLTPAQFKKGRPGQVLHVLCNLADTGRIAETMMEETGTLGVRYQQWNRFKLEREVKSIKLKIGAEVFDIRVKLARNSSGRIVRVKPEFEDLQNVAHAVSMPLREISDIALHEAWKVLKEKGEEV